jgi:cellulose synthase/poly-beta-1,6-N-acetylglucosamine synthase-like glycosyltransferase
MSEFTGSVLLASRVLLAFYYAILAVLALFGMHRMFLVVMYWRRRHDPPPRPVAAHAEWPIVTVQLPLYNEMYVAERLLDAVGRLDYPRARLEIQVLDDSADETTAIAAAAVGRLVAAGLDARLLHRDSRDGFKAGALAAGLAAARGDLLAVFDADFVPPPDFLTIAVPHFSDPGLGMVQGRWSHLNREASLLTRVQALLLDGHFVVEHTARNRSGCFFNFNGTAGIWRRAAIEQSGGWQHDTLTEDLDLSYRAQLAGWRFLYLPDLLVPAELPVDANAFKSQQRRWAKGSVQTARKLLGRICAAPLPLRVRTEAFIHLTNNLSYPLMVVLSLLIFPAMVLRRGSPVTILLLVDLPLFLAATVSVLTFYLVSQTRDRRSLLSAARTLPALMALGVGLAVNNSRAVLSGLGNRGGVFERTPKYALADGDSWRRRRYQVGLDASLWGEGALTLLLLSAMVTAWRTSMWLSLPFLYLFVQGYGSMLTWSLLPALFRRAGVEPHRADPAGKRA